MVLLIKVIFGYKTIEVFVDFVSCNVVNDKEENLILLKLLNIKPKKNIENMIKMLKRLMLIEIHSWFLLLSHFR
ncbi:hypothetical protein P9112_008549 [Eukaryota sp. TZLM1-RC]